MYYINTMRTEATSITHNRKEKIRFNKNVTESFKINTNIAILFWAMVTLVSQKCFIGFVKD
jgi:hypothetical protein